MHTKNFFYWIAVGIGAALMLSCNKNNDGELSYDESLTAIEESTSTINTITKDLEEQELITVWYTFKDLMSNFPNNPRPNHALNRNWRTLELLKQHEKNTSNNILSPNLWVEIAQLIDNQLIADSTDIHFGTYTFNMSNITKPDYEPEPHNAVIIKFPYKDSIAEVAWTNIHITETSTVKRDSWLFEITKTDQVLYSTNYALTLDQTETYHHSYLAFTAQIGERYDIKYNHTTNLTISADSTLVPDNMEFHFQLNEDEITVYKQDMNIKIDEQVGFFYNANMTMGTVEFRMTAQATPAQLQQIDTSQVLAEDLMNKICKMQLRTTSGGIIGKFVFKQSYNNHIQIDFVFTDGTTGNPHIFMPELYAWFDEWIRSNLNATLPTQLN